MPTLFSSSTPDHPLWQLTSPRPATAPKPLLLPNTGRSGNTALALSGNSKPQVFGSWSRTFQNLTPNTTYHLTAYARAENTPTPPNLHDTLFTSLTWLNASGKKLRAPDYLNIPHTPNRNAGVPPAPPAPSDWTKLELTTTSPPETTSVTLNLGLRWAPNTTAYFDDITLTPIPSPNHRIIQAAAAAINLKPGDTQSSADSVNRFVQLIDQSLPKNTDLLCLPEGITLAGTGKSIAQVAEPLPNSPTISALSALAKRHQTYLVAGLYELANEPTGETIYNTAILLDRSGTLIGTYRKTHLPQEETTAGITPGSLYPVFQTDFGKIGILICWDIQFPEPARALALQGAEIILLPIWGGNEILTRARAIENHIFLISASYHMKTFILNPAGQSLAEAPHPQQGLISAKINLDAQLLFPHLGDMKHRTWMERRADLAHTAT